MIDQGVQLDMTRTRPVSSMEALNYQQMCNCCLVGNTGLLPMDPSSSDGFLLTKADNARLGVVTDDDAPAQSNEQSVAERARKIAEDRLRRLRASEAFATVPLILLIVIVLGGIAYKTGLVSKIRSKFQSMRSSVPEIAAAPGAAAPAPDAVVPLVVPPGSDSAALAMNFFA